MSPPPKRAEKARDRRDKLAERCAKAKGLVTQFSEQWNMAQRDGDSPTEGELAAQQNALAGEVEAAVAESVEAVVVHSCEHVYYVVVCCPCRAKVELK